jgi:hypothetical protein
VDHLEQSGRLPVTRPSPLLSRRREFNADSAKSQGFLYDVEFNTVASAVASTFFATLKESKSKEQGMSSNSASETPNETPKARALDMRLEIVVIPVSDVDRAKRFTAAWVGGSSPTLPPATTSA